MAKKKLFESPRQTDTQHPETVVGLPGKKKRSGEGLKKNRVDEPAVKPKEDSRKKFRSSPKSNQPKRTKHQLKQPATMKQTNVRPNSKPRPNASRPPLPRRPTWLLVSGKSDEDGHGDDVEPTTDGEVSESIIDAQPPITSSNGKSSATTDHETSCHITSKTFYGATKRQKRISLRFADYQLSFIK